MFLLDKLLVGGLRFVFDKVATIADAELNDETRLREELLDAHMRFDMGEIDDDELARIEAALLPRLRELEEERRARAQELLDSKVTGVEVSFTGDDEEPRG